MSRSAANPDRWYFKCSKEHTNSFFWADEYHPAAAPPHAGGAAGPGAGSRAAAGLSPGHGTGAVPGGNYPGALAAALQSPSGSQAWGAGGGAHWSSYSQPQGSGAQYGSPRTHGAIPTPAMQRATPHQQQQQHSSPEAAAAGPAPDGPGRGTTVTVEDTGGGQLTYSVHPYNSAFREVMSGELKHTGRTWDDVAKVWRVGAQHHDEVKSALHRKGFALMEPPTLQQVMAAASTRGGPDQGRLVTVQVWDVGGAHFGYAIPIYDHTFKEAMDDLRHTGRTWEAEAKAWKFSGEHHQQVQAALQAKGFEVPDPPALVKRILITRDSQYNPKLTLDEAQDFIRSRAHPDTWARLFRYQREGVVQGVRFGGKVLFADEMGLGKTVQALTLMSLYPEAWPLLIICPTSLRHSWESAVQDWLPSGLVPDPRDLWVITAAADWDRRAREADMPATPGTGAGPSGVFGGGLGLVRPHVAIVSYGLVGKMPVECVGRYRAVICDESHLLKSRTTQRYKAVVPLVRAAQVAALCTGTPLLSKPIEAWTQVDLLRQGMLFSYNVYGERYCLSADLQRERYENRQQYSGGWTGAGAGGSNAWRGGHRPFPGAEFSGCCNAPELRSILTECVMVRRLKRNVLSDLPPKIRTKVNVRPNPSDLTPVTAALRRLKDVEAQRVAGRIGEEQADLERKEAWGAAYRATGPAKVPAALEFIKQLLQVGTEKEEDEEPGGLATAAGAAAADDEAEAAATWAAADSEGPAKLLVFAHHSEVLDRLQEGLRDARVSLVRIDGSTPAAQRQKLVDRFQAPPNGSRVGPRVALLSLQAAGVGLTLTAASIVVFVELDQTPAVLTQAEDRAHRVGQAASVAVYYLMGVGTLDEKIWRMLDNKKFMTGAVTDGRREGAAGQEGAAEMDMDAALQAAAEMQRTPQCTAPRTGQRPFPRRRRPSWESFEDHQAPAEQGVEVDDGDTAGTGAYGNEHRSTMPFAEYGAGAAAGGQAAAAVAGGNGVGASEAQQQQQQCNAATGVVPGAGGYTGGVGAGSSGVSRGAGGGGNLGHAFGSAAAPTPMDCAAVFESRLPVRVPPPPAAAVASPAPLLQTPPPQPRQPRKDTHQQQEVVDLEPPQAGSRAVCSKLGSGSGSGRASAAGLGAAVTAAEEGSPGHGGSVKRKLDWDSIIEIDVEADHPPQIRAPGTGLPVHMGYGGWVDGPNSQHSISNLSSLGARRASDGRGFGGGAGDLRMADGGDNGNDGDEGWQHPGERPPGQRSVPGTSGEPLQLQQQQQQQRSQSVSQSQSQSQRQSQVRLSSHPGVSGSKGGMAVAGSGVLVDLTQSDDDEGTGAGQASGATRGRGERVAGAPADGASGGSQRRRAQRAGPIVID